MQRKVTEATATLWTRVRTWTLAEQMVLLAIVVVLAGAGVFVASRAVSVTLTGNPKADFVQATTKMCQATDNYYQAELALAGMWAGGGRPDVTVAARMQSLTGDVLRAEYDWYDKSARVALSTDLRSEVDRWNDTFGDTMENDSPTLDSSCWSMLDAISAELG